MQIESEEIHIDRTTVKHTINQVKNRKSMRNQCKTNRIWNNEIIRFSSMDKNMSMVKIYRRNGKDLTLNQYTRREISYIAIITEVYQ